VLAPKLVDEAVGRNHLVRVDEEEGEELPLLASCERHGRVVGDYLERTEQAVLHERKVKRGFSARPGSLQRPPASSSHRL
jgi:hypothetical protein